LRGGRGPTRRRRCGWPAAGDVARLTGELRSISGITVNNNTVNFIGSPEFGVLSEGLLAIARQHPESKADIVALLRGLDMPADALEAPRGIDSRPRTRKGCVRPS
jgi:hypothetical protein